MAPFIGPLRRHRLLILVLAVALAVFVFSSQSSSSRARYDNPRKGGLGTNTWGDEEWQDDHLVNDEFGPKPNPVKDLLKWTGKAGDKTVLVTGGAGSLAHALIDQLVESKYTVHAVDIVPRPATLPAAVVYHRVDVTGTGVSELVKQTQFEGIVHFAAISLEQWCAPNPEACERVNVQSTRSVMTAIQSLVDTSSSGGSPWSSKQRVPWLIFGSSMEVYGSGEQGTVVESTATKPTNAIGKTKLAAENVIRDAFNSAQRSENAHVHDSSPNPSHLCGAILRFSDIYGYPRATNVPAAFIPRLLQHAVSSLPIQFSSDNPPLDLLHVKDAVDAVVHVMAHLSKHDGDDEATLDTFNIVGGGKRWMAEELVDAMRLTLKSQSPVRDIGDHKVSLTGSAEYSNEHARDLLNWAPQVTDFVTSLRNMAYDLAYEVAVYTQDFVDEHCGAHTPKVMLPEDARNRDLYKLHNCTVNLGFNHDGWLHHVKCQDGKHCLADDKRVVSYNWNATVWNIHVMDKSKKSNGRATVRFWQENGMGWLGLRKDDIEAGGEVKWEMFLDNDPVPHVDTFEVEVAPDNSALRVLLPGRKAQQISAVSNGAETEFKLETLDGGPAHYDMRMTMLCCQSEGDWPLLLDDHESADIRFGTEGQISFNASRRLHLCDRAQQANEHFNTLLMNLTGEATATGKLRPLTDKPDNWALKELPPCWNDCSSPTICMQTGKCRCVQADNCPRRRENPLIALGRGVHPDATKTSSPLGGLGGYTKTLAHMVDKLDWRDILLPEARDYLQAHPEFIKIHVVDNYPRQAEIEAAECHKLQPSHCFSADSIMYKAMRHLSVPADDAQLIVLPVYQHCTGADFIMHQVWHHAANTIKGINEQEKFVSLMMTHDWGICLDFTWEIWESRNRNEQGVPRLYPDPIMKNSLVWSVMGDWDTRCYRPGQDVVVPSRTCLSIKLVERFPDVHSIQPARDRPQLINWSGTFWGTGKSERLRLTCHRGGVADEELVPGGGPQSVFYDWADYMTNLNSARFCPQPRGVAGWSPRVNDAIYAGCIPILLAEGSHYPFANMLDWSQFSVRIHPTELDQIERILHEIPIERVEQMQANLIAIREAFLYATDEHPEAELERRGPMFFALHEAGMRLRTKYPDRHAG